MGKGARTQTSLRSLRKLDCAAAFPRVALATSFAVIAWARRYDFGVASSEIVGRAFAHPTAAYGHASQAARAR